MVGYYVSIANLNREDIPCFSYQGSLNLQARAYHYILYVGSAAHHIQPCFGTRSKSVFEALTLCVVTSVAQIAAKLLFHNLLELVRGEFIIVLGTNT